jgi:hypothetical protein
MKKKKWAEFSFLDNRGINLLHIVVKCKKKEDE